MIVMNREPLQPGTIIEHRNRRAKVVEDSYAEPKLLVEYNGYEELWRWEYEGECCRVVSVPAQEIDADEDPRGLMDLQPKVQPPLPPSPTPSYGSSARSPSLRDIAQEPTPVAPSQSAAKQTLSMLRASLKSAQRAQG